MIAREQLLETFDTLAQLLIRNEKLEAVAKAAEDHAYLGHHDDECLALKAALKELER